MVTRTDLRCLQVTPIVTNLNIVNINVNVVNLALINLVKVNGGPRININQVSTTCHARSVFELIQQPYCLCVLTLTCVVRAVLLRPADLRLVHPEADAC